MKVPSPTEGRTRPSPQGMGYLQPAVPNFNGLVSGITAVGAAYEDNLKASKAERDKLTEYNAQIAFNGFETETQGLVDGLKKSADPALANFPEVVETEYTNFENKFIESLPPELQSPYRVKTSEKRQTVLEDARVFDLQQRGAYYKRGIDQGASRASTAVEASSAALEDNIKRVDELIDSSDLSVTEKENMKQLNHAQLQGIAYRKDMEEHKRKTQGSSSDLAKAIKRGAAELGIDPIDLATVISYETGGKFSTSIRGGKNNKHIGFIQFGEAEQLKYGARQGQSFDDQMTSVIAYLKDRGLKPGMSLLDLYSTINAGGPGRYNASDAGSGGAPGSVHDKVTQQMEGHKKNAVGLFGGTYEVPDDLDSNPRYQDVAYEDRIALRKQADTNSSAILTTLANEQKARQAEYINSFKLKVLDGVYGQKELDEARQYGMISDFEDVRNMQGMIDKRNEDGKDLRDVQAKFDSKEIWSFLDEKDSKIANTWFNNVDKGALEKGDKTYFDNILLPFVKYTKMIPKDAIGTLDAMSRQQQPTALFALEALSKIHSNEPDAYERQVPEDIRKNVDFWEARRNAGYDVKETLDLIGGRLSIEQRNAREVYGKQADSFFNDPNNVGYFDKVLESFSPDTNLPFDSTAQAPVWGTARLGMESDWKTIYKESLIKSQGDHAVAEAMTRKQVERTWGTTSFGGRFTLMKFPPNKTGYDESNGPWIEEQARTELQIPEETPMQLISDDQTQADVMAKRPASYLVVTQTPDGWQLATNAQGQIVRQHFVKTPEILEREQETFNIKQMQYEVNQALLRLVEAHQHARWTGIEVPQELIESYDAQRLIVDEAEKAFEKKWKKPVAPEGAKATHLKKTQKAK